MTCCKTKDGENRNDRISQIAVNRVLLERNNEALEEKYSVVRFQLPPREKDEPTEAARQEIAQAMSAICGRARPESALISWRNGIYLLVPPGTSLAPLAVSVGSNEYVPTSARWDELDDWTCARLALNSFTRGLLDKDRNNVGDLFVKVGENASGTAIQTVEVKLHRPKDEHGMFLSLPTRTFTKRQVMLQTAERSQNSATREKKKKEYETLPGFVLSIAAGVMVRSKQGEDDFILKTESKFRHSHTHFLAFPKIGGKPGSVSPETEAAERNRRAEEISETKTAVLNAVIEQVNSRFSGGLAIKFDEVEATKREFRKRESYKNDAQFDELIPRIVVSAPAAAGDETIEESLAAINKQKLIAKLKAAYKDRDDAPKKWDDEAIAAALRNEPDIDADGKTIGMNSALRKAGLSTGEQLALASHLLSLRIAPPAPAWHTPSHAPAKVDEPLHLVVVADKKEKEDGYGETEGVTQHITASHAIEIATAKGRTQNMADSTIATIVKEFAIKLDVRAGKMTAFAWDELGLDELRCWMPVIVGRRGNRKPIYDIRELVIAKDGSMSYLEDEDLTDAEDNRLEELLHGERDDLDPSRCAFKLVRGEEESRFVIKMTKINTLPRQIDRFVSGVVAGEGWRCKEKMENELSGLFGIGVFTDDCGMADDRRLPLNLDETQETSTYYFVGYDTSVQNKLTNQVPVRKIVKTGGFDPLEDVLKMIDTGLMRYGRPAANPIPIKYLREFYNLEFAGEDFLEEDDQ